MEFRKADVTNENEKQAKKDARRDISHQKIKSGNEASDRSEKQKLLAEVQQDLRALAASADVSQSPRKHPLQIEDSDDLFSAERVKQVKDLFKQKKTSSSSK